METSKKQTISREEYKEAVKLVHDALVDYIYGYKIAHRPVGDGFREDYLLFAQFDKVELYHDCFKKMVVRFKSWKISATSYIAQNNETVSMDISIKHMPADGVGIEGESIVTLDTGSIMEMSKDDIRKHVESQLSRVHHKGYKRKISHNAFFSIWDNVATALSNAMHKIN